MPSKASPSNSEWLTRKQLVDAKLKDAGWTITKFRPGSPISNYQRCAVEEFQTDAGPADYALCADGLILGMVEAKKLSLGPQNVLTQAERYSKAITQPAGQAGKYGVPFLYSTNGEVIWYHDVRHQLNRSRQIMDFHTPDALKEQLQRNLDAACGALAATSNDNPRLRPYQRQANDAVETAIAGRKRLMLLAMATGTGKTFVMVNQIYRLMKSGVGRRILFLVDRRALAAQAVRAFTSFEAAAGLKFDKIYDVFSQRFQREDFGEEENFDPKVLPASYLLAPKPGQAFVYVSTIQRMAINLFGREAVWAERGDEEFDEDAEKLDIPIHAFDVIVADECHRGYTSSEAAVWRKALDHFDAIKIGLTATPAAHTTAYFKDIVFRYEYERAVREGFLVDYDVVNVRSNVRMKGIFLKAGEEVGLIDSATGQQHMDVLEDEREFESSQVEHNITSPDSNRKILEELKKFTDAHEQEYARFPKTLIFAVNDLPHTSHADHLVDIARDVFGRGDSFIEKITGKVDRPLQKIREFRNRPAPSIAVTVDMLTTGVDIPDLEFIVFLRPVKSRILFEQMIGRGTRRGEKFPDKSHFTVFDCFDGTLFEYFRQATAITVEPPAPPTRTVLQIIDDVWNNRDRDYNVRCLVKRLQRIDKEMSGEAREEFSAFIADGDVATLAAGLPQALTKNFTATMKVLRDPAFQNLLIGYKRKERGFIVSYDTTDEVSSSWLVRGADGKEYKPQDYLVAFGEYVKSHETDIDSITVLLKRPQEWSPEVLGELREKLKAAPQRFTVQNLQKAHELHYRKALVDVISMVKHAANDQSPLLNAAERVDHAFAQVTVGKTFTPEQQQWLDRIKTHMQENLSIDKEDFDLQPLFARFGGLARVTTVFRGQLPVLIRELNEAIAA